MNGTWRYAFVCALTALALLFATDHVAATPANPRIIYSFCPAGAPCVGGKYPTGLVRGPDGAYYGVTAEGGIGNAGVVFRADPVTLVASVLHRFDRKNEGANPVWITVGSDGNLYGTLSAGGSTGFGNIFRITLAGDFMEVHAFDHESFFGAMAADNEGNIFGTLLDEKENTSIIYKLASDGSFETLYTLGTGGGAPFAAGIVRAADGNLYGTTYIGGKYDEGMAFRLSLDGDFTDLHDFTLTEGTPPSYPAIGPDGALYGTLLKKTGLSMYRIDLDGQVELTPIFNDRNYSLLNEPLLLMPDGYLYGARTNTGVGDTIFRLSPTGDFSELCSGPLFDIAPLVRGFRDDAIYGTIRGGGNYGGGAIFRCITSPVQ